VDASQGATHHPLALATHPLGWELRPTVDSDLLRSTVCKIEADVFNVSRVDSLPRSTCELCRI